MRDTYYYVYRYLHGTPICRHRFECEAAREAKRLANKHPGTEFEVLMCVGVAKAKDPVKFERLNPSPF